MKLKSMLLTVSVACFLAFSLPAAEVHAAEGGGLASAGCKTEHFLLQDLAQAYKAKTGKQVRLAKTGNKKAVNLMLAKKIDFAYTCKPIVKLSKKLKLDQDKISSWKSVPIGKDPIVIVSNRTNGVSDLSIAQLTEIFQGKNTNWKEVGGNDVPIISAYINPELESGTLLLFKEFTVGMKGELDAKAKKLNGPSMLGNFVASNPGGVTFMPLNSYEEKFGDILKINGVSPDKENILNGKYSLSATYYLTYDQAESEDVQGFVDYCLSAEGKEIIAKNFIPYSE